MRNLEDVDHAHRLLLGAVLPLLLPPLGSAAVPRPRLRGVVRVDEKRSRVVLTDDSAMASGVAFEVSHEALHPDAGSSFEVDQVLAHLRSISIEDIDRLKRDEALPRDVHGNRVVTLAGEGLAAPASRISSEQELLTVFQLMQRGPILPSVKDVFWFTGFMLRADESCRIYVSLADNGTSYGLDVPLQRAGGRSIAGMAASFELELTMKLGNDGELYEPITDRDDEYCAVAYDLESWLNPPES
ncbi:hypothetical protein FXF50_14125 [Micromonospora sp. AP08]|uniref:hypothetical protein n=1 Tax=Micromonospora sp. AP08 TaxID=2604467 RepID=UPI0011DC70EA|nr:hypothetical protein [Micromonospora sp. AP08]TYB37415.1 hypothetical protein FXF50_14125 [Micromonospora sp. AP08]